MLIDDLTAATIWFDDGRAGVRCGSHRRSAPPFASTTSQPIQADSTQQSLLGQARRRCASYELPVAEDTVGNDRDRIVARLSSILTDPKHGKVLSDDLRGVINTLPVLMQEIVRERQEQDREHRTVLQRGRASGGRPVHRAQTTRP